MRQIESNQGPVEFEVFEDIIMNGMPANTEISMLEQPVMNYPTKISQIRAYVYACTAAEDNTNVMNDDSFLAGCNRFAIENPVPSISLRCGLYGNSMDVMSLLAEAQEKYGKPIKIDSKQYTAHNMGLPEPREKVHKV